MKRTLLSFCFMWILSVPTFSVAEGYRIRLPVGRTRTVPVGKIKRIVVGDSGIVGAKVLGGKELLLTGRQAGMTNLEIVLTTGETRRYLVRVLSQDPSVIINDLEQLFRDLSGLQVRAIGEKVLVEGTCLSNNCFKLSQKILSGYPMVLNLVQPPPVALGRMVALELVLVEISESQTNQIGIAWPEQLGADLSATLTQSLDGKPFSGTIGLASSLRQVLNMLSQQGNARILARPVLVAKDGEQSIYDAGGQIPVPVATGIGQSSVSWKPYGLNLSFTPRIDQHGNVELKLKVTTSRLDYGNAVQSAGGTIPALKSRSTEGTVNLAPGEALMISELYLSEDGKSNRQVPFLGSIPIVGELFRSRSTRSEQQRSMLAVIPRALLPGSLDKKSAAVAEKAFRDAQTAITPNWIEAIP